MGEEWGNALEQVQREARGKSLKDGRELAARSEWKKDLKYFAAHAPPVPDWFLEMSEARFKSQRVLEDGILKSPPAYKQEERYAIENWPWHYAKRVLEARPSEDE